MIDKYSMAMDLEKMKLKELEDFKCDQQASLSLLEREYEDKIKNIHQELDSYREDIRMGYSTQFDQESLAISNSMERQLKKIQSHDQNDLELYAREIAQLLVKRKGDSF